VGASFVEGLLRSPRAAQTGFGQRARWAQIFTRRHNQRREARSTAAELPGYCGWAGRCLLCVEPPAASQPAQSCRMAPLPLVPAVSPPVWCCTLERDERRLHEHAVYRPSSPHSSGSCTRMSMCLTGAADARMMPAEAQQAGSGTWWVSSFLTCATFATCRSALIRARYGSARAAGGRVRVEPDLRRGPAS
jgi:hypothetical protein